MFYMFNYFFLMFLCISINIFMLGLYFLYFNMELFFEFNILSLNSVSFLFIFFIDWISLIFMSFVFFISSMIMKYSDEYMYGDMKIKRFSFLMIMFVMSMMLLIFSPNLVSILLGWDGLGLVSYALVIYYQNVKSFNAGMLTALSNRLGDAALLMSITMVFNLGSWSVMNYLEVMLESNDFIMVSFFIIFASITKSAQIPFSAWLPAAMAAPTPVSSLVHSSTLVTAGVYLLFRFNYMISDNMYSILLVVSLLTMFMAGLGANFEFDLKKIIALSTLSQLGMMIVIMSLGSNDLAFFHLLIHALFKALLFMCAGVLIHNLGNCQDIRYMGGVINLMPSTCISFNISNFALCGLPFLSGFYSKDLIAEMVSMQFLSCLIYSMFYISVGLTVSYSIRLSYYMFFGNMNYMSLMYFNDSNNKIMLKGMLGLIFLVILKGSILMWMLFPTFYFILLPLILKLFTLCMIFIGAIMGYELSMVNYNYSQKSFYTYKFILFFVSMWNLPVLSTFGLNSYFLRLGKVYSKNFDQGWMEYYGSKNLFFLVKMFTQFLQLLSKNHLKLFLLVLLFFFFYLFF